MFDEPRVKITPEINIRIANVLAEISQEVSLSITKLLPDFKPLFRYDDLYPCNRELNKKIQLYTPFYILKQKMIKSSIPDSYINQQFE